MEDIKSKIASTGGPKMNNTTQPDYVKFHDDKVSQPRIRLKSSKLCSFPDLKIDPGQAHANRKRARSSWPELGLSAVPTMKAWCSKVTALYMVGIWGMYLALSHPCYKHDQCQWRGAFLLNPMAKFIPISDLSNGIPRGNGEVLLIASCSD